MRIGTGRLLILFFLTGLAVRLVLAPFTSVPYDMAAWAGSINAMNQGEGLYDSAFFWYTPSWGYILSSLTPIMDYLNVNVQGTIVPGLSDNSIMMSTSVITSCTFNLIVKIPLIAFDLLVGFVLYKLVGKLVDDERKAVVAAGLWLLCPLTVWMSGVQAQFDCLSVLGMVASIYCMFSRRFFIAGAMIAYAGITKMFPAILVPLMVAYVLCSEQTLRASLKNLEGAMFGAVVMALILFLPVMMTGDLQNSLAFLTNRVESVGSDGNSLMSWNGIIAAAPVIILVALFLAVRFARHHGDLNRDFVMYGTATVCLFFIWPIYPSFPQYILVLIPMMILVGMYGKDITVPYVLLSLIMTASIVLWTGPAVVYPMAIYTDLLSPDTVAGAVSGLADGMMEAYRGLEPFKCLPAIILILVMVGRKRLEDLGGRVRTAWGNRHGDVQ